MKALQRFCLFAIVSFVFCPAAQASSATGTIKYIDVWPSNSAVLITMDAALVGTPACNETKRFVLDISTDPGRAAYAALLSAKLSAQRVTVVGSGACAFLPGTQSEEARVIRFLGE